ncbi:hypothetical protein AC249_AIPGENE9359 [Exaiptasia diaphana]|nr:hypothetical protein AC249_AIPGENE9359 [Exaiptasia diaphana]
MKSIMTAMERSNVTRIVAITSWCTETEPGNPKIMEWLIKPLFLNAYLPDMRRMEKMLEESLFNFTVIRPPRLTNDEAKKNYKIVEGQFVAGVSRAISRADTADASLKVLLTHEWDRKAVAIGCNQ